MISRPLFRHCATAIGLLTSVLWLAQVTAGWQPRQGDARFTQLDRALTQIIESQRGGGFQAFTPDRKSEPPALPPSALTPAPRHSREGLIAGRQAVVHGQHAISLPGIRAPPADLTSS